MTHDQLTELLDFARRGNFDAAVALTAELRAFAADADRDRPAADWAQWKSVIEACQKLDRWPMLQVYAEVALRAEFARRARSADARRFT